LAWVALAGAALALVLAAGAGRAAFAELSVARQAFASGIESKEPAGVATSFPSGVGKLYFFTQLVGSGAPAEILHVWLYDGQEVAIFPIEVKSTPWRTWSVRAIAPEQRGDWTVEVREVGGRVLSSATCRIE
jgi:hypothetical protein